MLVGWNLALSCCTMDDVLRIVDAGREYSGYYA